MNNSIRIRCSKSNLKKVRDFVTDFLEPYDLSPLLQNQIILAVDEITANLIKHSNREDESKFIDLKIFRIKDCLLFEFSDKGLPFDKEVYEEPNMEEDIHKRGKSGMGLFLVKKIMDKVEFHSDSKNNIWRLSKKLETV
jgi:serine/threonine-protein kinase RsbW